MSTSMPMVEINIDNDSEPREDEGQTYQAQKTDESDIQGKLKGLVHLPTFDIILKV